MSVLSGVTMITETVQIPIGGGDAVSGIVCGPDAPGPDDITGVVLAHGAANDMNHPLLVALAEGFAASGYATLRFNFRYRERGRKSPDGQAVLVQTWMQAVRALRNDTRYHPLRIVAAGKSMGGRVASQMIADGELDVNRLILLGYPLHAPGRKDRLRDAHLYRIHTPMLFFAGTRDPLCDLGRLKGVLNRLTAEWALEVVQGGDHSFRLPKASSRSAVDVQSQIVNRSLTWLSTAVEGGH
jgi:predicted alpha/beta-hydrolase family hydrolase